MKKSFVWMFAAVLTCGLTISSCTKVDAPVVDPETVEHELDLEADGLDITQVFPVAEASRMTVSIVDDETMDKAIKFYRNGSSGKGFAYNNFSDKTENATAVKMSFDFMIPAAILAPSAITVGDATVHNTETGINAGQYGYTDNGAIFNIGATRGKINGSNTNYFMLNNQPLAVDNDAYEKKAADVWGKWFHVDLAINVAQKTYSYVVKQDNEIWAAGDTTFISANAEACTQIDVASGNTGTYNIANLCIQKVSYDKSIKYADYTIKFTDTEGQAIPEELGKTDITRRGKVGSEITLLASDTANFQTADGATKYVFQSHNAAGATITEAGTTITVIYKVEEAAKYKYVVNCMTDDTKKSLVQYKGEQFEGVTTYIYPSLGYKMDGVYYMIAPNNKYNGYEVKITGTESTTAGYIINTLNYSKDETIVYWGEMEEIAKTNVSGEVTSWVSYNNNPFNRFSGGAGIKMADGGYVWTDALEAGAYNIELYGRQDGKGGIAPVIGYRDAEGNVTWIEYEKADWGSAWMVRELFENVTIPANCSVVVGWKGTGITNSIDCIKITKYVAPAE